MKEIDQIAAKLGVSSRTVYRRLEDVPRKKESPTHKISVRLSADNYARLKGGLYKVKENMSACINHIIKEYFNEQ